MRGKPPVNRKKITMVIVFAVIAVFALTFSTKILETVNKGEYHIIQRPITGTMEAKMKTGMYLQMFADVKAWPKSNTFFFTFDSSEGAAHDQSIEVRFNDGSVARISGTLRILLPTGETQAIELMTKMNFQSYKDLEARFILPIVRNSLRLTANLMTARESYAEKRPDFIAWAWDQIQNGTFMTEEKQEYVEDPLTKQQVLKKYKVIRTGKDGNTLREHNPLEGTGIRLANFEIKSFEYEEKVKKQISEQQENLMAIATARAQAERAEQDAKTKEAQGKAKVMTAKYEKEQEKIKAVVDAEKEKEVAELAAQKELEVAKLAKLAAAETKEKEILLGEGEAQRKKLVMAADGALKQKLATIERINKVWADAYSARKVPTVFMAGGGVGGKAGPDDQFKTFMNMMNSKVAKDLALDMSVKGLGTDKQ